MLREARAEKGFKTYLSARYDSMLPWSGSTIHCQTHYRKRTE